ncbi:hypothetical protein [Roseivirga thermotolerans]|uniref:hypothetical protein n=1 Tax=Roseivirga thermotolerans TaxID=1758176 RepID=UPI00273FD106|nr:hypothetical protein [Roseivirga thermotolerans]
MNLLKPTIVFVLFFLIIDSSNAQSARGESRLEDSLVGTWAFDYDSSFRSLSSEVKKGLTKNGNRFEKLLRGQYEFRVYEFTDQGLLTISIPSGDLIKGSWIYDSKEKLLKVVYESGQVKEFIVSGIGTNNLKLKLKSKKDESETLIFKQIHLRKQ